MAAAAASPEDFRNVRRLDDVRGLLIAITSFGTRNCAEVRNYKALSGFVFTLAHYYSLVLTSRASFMVYIDLPTIFETAHSLGAHVDSRRMNLVLYS
jgi:hypothetical protein